MAQFRYEAMNKQGNEVSGVISATDQGSAIAHIQESELIVLDIQEEKEKKVKRKGSNKKVKVADLSLFSRQLAAMLGAGIPVTQSISTLAKQTENISLAQALEDIGERVKSGSNLTDAFAAHKKVFPGMFVSMIGAGEVGGILETSLLRLSVQLQKEKQLNDNIKSATSYPKMVGCFAIFMFVAMLVGLVPVFQGMIGPDIEVNSLTKFTFAVSNSMRTKSLIWILAVASIIFIVYRFVKSPIGHNLWEGSKMKMPLFGKIIQKTVIARFCRTLATLLQGGIPIVQALESAGPTAGSDLVAKAVENAITQIESGRSISQPLEESGLFPPMVTNMIAIGEEAGTLTELLDKVAEFYEDDVATETKSLSAVIEPVMLIAVGLLVGGMLISLYMPIFTAVAG
ncbi:MAG: type II secretion system F family protein [Oscillospiraceae bacterium]